MQKLIAMKYTVQISEILQRVIEVDADSPNEAESVVRGLYRRGAIVLDASDHVATETMVV